MEEELAPKYSRVTGEKIKQKSFRKIKKEHAKTKKMESKNERKLGRKVRRVGKQLHVAGEEQNAPIEERTSQTKVLIVKKSEKGEPVSLRRKIMNLLSYALVGVIAVVFGYFAGTFYIANVLNKVDFSAFSESTLRDNAQQVYSSFISSGTNPSKHGAIELFVATEYLLNQKDSYQVNVTGVIQPSIGKAQNVWGTKEVTPTAITSSQVSMGMLSVGEKSVYDRETMLTQVYAASSFSGHSATFEGEHNEYTYDEYREIYGVAPDLPSVDYIVSSKTVIEGSETVTQLAGNRYQISFALSTDSSVLNYVKKQKHMSGLKDYPSFKAINITAVIEYNPSNSGDELRFVTIRSDESYTVMYFGVMATCSGYVLNEFSY